MQVKPIKIQKSVKILTDPKPEFVSMVTRGANLTPYRIVKAEDGVEITEDNKEYLIIKADGLEIKELQFSKSVYKSETDVKNYLDNYGYADYNIEDKLTEFVVKSSEPVEFEENLKTIKLNDSVVMQVGKVKIDTVKKTDGNEFALIVKGSNCAELVSKYSDYTASYSRSASLKDVMETGSKEDQLPPGMYEINNAFQTTVKNALASNNYEAVINAAQDYGNLVITLSKLFKGFMEENIQKSQEKLDNNKIHNLISKTFSNYMSNTMDTVKKEEGQVAPATPPVADATHAPVVATAEPAKTDVPVAQENTPTPAQPAEPAKDPQEEMIAKIMTGVQGIIAQEVKKISDEVTAVKETVKKSEEEITNLKQVQPVRKSADDGDNPSNVAVSVQKAEEVRAVSRLRNAIGAR